MGELTTVQREADAYLEGAMERLKEALDQALLLRDSRVVREVIFDRDREGPGEWHLSCGVWATQDFITKPLVLVAVRSNETPDVQVLGHGRHGFERLHAISRLLPDIMDTLARICAKED